MTRIETLHVHTRDGSWPYTLGKSLEERLHEVEQKELVDKVHITDKLYLFDDPKKKIAVYERFKERCGKLSERFSFGFELTVFFSQENRCVELLACDISDMNIWKEHPKTVERACEFIEKSDGILILPHPCFGKNGIGESGTRFIVKELGYRPAIEINYFARIYPKANSLASTLAKSYQLPKVCGLDGWDEGIDEAVNIFYGEFRKAIQNNNIEIYFSYIRPIRSFKRLLRAVSDRIIIKHSNPHQLL